jgi:ABC-type phosphate transport system substrate-binding protein
MTAISRIRRRTLFSVAIGLMLSGTVGADVVAVVSSKNPLTSLTHAQVADIFLGKALRFPDGTVAVPIDQKEGSAERNEFYVIYTGKSPAQLKSHWSKIIFTGRGQPPRAVSSSTEVRQLVAANPQVIGYIERSAVDSSVKVLGQP